MYFSLYWITFGYMYLRHSRQKRADGSTLAHLQLAENVWGPERKRSRWRNIHGDRQQLKMAQLASPNGTVWQVTEPAPNAAKQLKSPQIKPPLPILDVH